MHMTRGLQGNRRYARQDQKRSVHNWEPGQRALAMPASSASAGGSAKPYIARQPPTCAASASVSAYLHSSTCDARQMQTSRERDLGRQGGQARPGSTCSA